MEVNDLRVRIEQGKRGAPVAVARLAHRPWIDQIPRRRLQLQRHRFRLAHRAVFRTESIRRRTVRKESPLQVCVSKESQRNGQCNQWGQRVSQGNNILVLIVRRAVNWLNVT